MLQLKITRSNLLCNPQLTRTIRTFRPVFGANARRTLDGRARKTGRPVTEWQPVSCCWRDVENPARLLSGKSGDSQPSPTMGLTITRTERRAIPRGAFEAECSRRELERFLSSRRPLSYRPSETALPTRRGRKKPPRSTRLDRVGYRSGLRLNVQFVA